METTQTKKQTFFIVPKILLFPDLLFVHCVTFRESKKSKTKNMWNSGVFRSAASKFLNVCFHFFVTFGGF